MTVVSGLVRYVAAEAERRLREGLDLMSRLGLDRTRLDAYDERLRRMEQTLDGQQAELRSLRADLDSLVTQLNDRVLPRLDERMDDTERDLATVATGVLRQSRDNAANGTRLESVEQRVGDLRSRLSRVEQRAGLWRDLQANLARLGEDLDALRTRLTATDNPLGTEARP
ncbi:hypothetical protein [Actinomadura miaoliensis]|uniref:Uncharacterized protein n=1 Tax=Actinomadura miaoliensis TaxID=430685 RepID=A0ABP7W890_9ACTN